jgi:hypothetical protein
MSSRVAVIIVHIILVVVCIAEFWLVVHLMLKFLRMPL